jgi:pyruvate dehydrogenase E1 component alpha subunit
VLLGRRFDERMLALQRQGRTGTFAPIRGQEAAQLGVVAALKESFWYLEAPARRDAGRRLRLTAPLEDAP